VPTQSLHVTLAFLGSVLERRIPELTSVARRVADAFAADGTPLQLVFDRVEHWKKAQIVCATVGAESPSAVATIGSLAEMLKRESASAGFAPDLKPFRAHVTVARKVAHASPTLALQPVLWSFDAFALIESRTDPTGPVYSVIESYLLVKTEKVHE
jgi:RNA 2',3'-cyclic 3'-phosphodiesterase